MKGEGGEEEVGKERKGGKPGRRGGEEGEWE